MAGHSLDPVRDALREFEEAVRTHQKMKLGPKVMELQDVDRGRQRVIDAVMELVRATLAERGVQS